MRHYVVVTPYFPSPGDWRGAYCLDFARALERKLGTEGGWKVHVFKEGRGGDYEVEGTTVHAFPARRLPSNAFPQLFARSNAASFMSALKRAGIEAGDVAVCHVHSVHYGHYALAVKKANGACLTILHHHNLQDFGLNDGALRRLWPYNALQFPLVRKVHESIDLHAFVSDLARKSFLAAPDAGWTDYVGYRLQMRGLGFFRSARIRDSLVLHNGVDTRTFHERGMRERHDGLVIGCVANFNEIKDQMTLIKAVEALNRGKCVPGGTRVVFMGSGETRAKCERYAREHGVDAVFLSEVRHRQLAEFYRKIDLFVLPSVFEGFGCVYTEAHACGVPFIACEGQGIGEVLPPEERGRWLCRMRDPEDLAAKIRGYAENRWTQRLAEDQDVDSLVGGFWESVKARL